MKEKSFPRYLDREHILFSTKAPIKYPWNVFSIFSQFAIFPFLIKGLTGDSPRWYVYFCFFWLVYICVFGVLFWNILHKQWSTYYIITELNVIEIRGKGFLPFFRKQKQIKIKLNNIEYIELSYNNLELVIFPKNFNYKYTGDETDYLKTPSNIRKHFICIDFRGKRGQRIIDKMFNLLKETLNLKRHPNLDEIFIPN